MNLSGPLASVTSMGEVDSHNPGNPSPVNPTGSAFGFTVRNSGQTGGGIMPHSSMYPQLTAYPRSIAYPQNPEMRNSGWQHPQYPMSLYEESGRSQYGGSCMSGAIPGHGSEVLAKSWGGEQKDTKSVSNLSANVQAPETKGVGARDSSQNIKLAESETAGNKTRRNFSAHQRTVLEGKFQEKQVITREEKNEIAQEINLTVKQVAVWFQNRRTKYRISDSLITSGGIMGRRVRVSEKAKMVPSFARFSIIPSYLQQPLNNVVYKTTASALGIAPPVKPGSSPAIVLHTGPEQPSSSVSNTTSG